MYSDDTGITNDFTSSNGNFGTEANTRHDLTEAMLAAVWKGQRHLWQRIMVANPAAAPARKTNGAATPSPAGEKKRRFESGH